MEVYQEVDESIYEFPLKITRWIVDYWRDLVGEEGLMFENCVFVCILLFGFC